MTALFIPHFAKEKSIIILIFFSLSVWIYPEISMAASLQSEGQNQPLIFEVKNPISNSQSENAGLQLDEIAQNDPLVNNLRIYLEKHRSPLAEYADQIILEPQWPRALAISWVESNFCRKSADKNCSGIGVAPGHRLWRKYPTHLEWFKDMTALLEKPIYKEKYTTFKKMKGVYVQPGSMRWVYGAQTKYDELIKLAEESAAQRQLIAQKQAEKVALATFPGLSNLE